MDFSLLTHKKQIIFTASCCERLLPNYQAFSLKEKFGNHDFLRLNLDNIWKFVLDSDTPKFNSNIIEELLANCPDTENYLSFYASLAGDAVSSIIYTIENVISSSKRSDLVGTVVEVSKNSIYQYLSIVNDPIADSHIENTDFENSLHYFPLYKMEIETQSMDYSDLMSTSDIILDDMARAIRSRSATRGIQPIKRGLI